MTGNVPNQVWLSPRGLLTLRFSVHAQQRLLCEWFISLTGEFCRNIWGLRPQLRAHLVSDVQRRMFGRADMNSKSVQIHPRYEPEEPVSFLLSSSRQKQKRRGVNLNLNETPDKADNIALFIGFFFLVWSSNMCKKGSSLTRLNCWPQPRGALIFTSG